MLQNSWKDTYQPYIAGPNIVWHTGSGFLSNFSNAYPFYRGFLGDCLRGIKVGCLGKVTKKIKACFVHYMF